MNQSSTLGDTAAVSAIDAEIKALSARNTPALRAVRQKYTRALRSAEPDYVLRFADELCRADAYRWLAYELLRNHRATFERIGAAALERFGRGLDSWWVVDAFSRTLSCPAWLRDQISDQLIFTRARSEDRWWRRAALVSTVALNVRSQGGAGDVPRTLEVCRLLVHDRDDMVIKALSWALRELVVHDAGAVRAFLAEHEAALAARVKREVGNKLQTGFKNPTRS